MEMVFRAKIPATGEILESDVFKNVYRCSMQTAKDAIDSDTPVVVVELEKAWYSDYQYVNQFGYLHRDIVRCEHIAYLAISERGYTIDCASGVFDIDRTGWKSVQRKVKV